MRTMVAWLSGCLLGLAGLSAKAGLDEVAVFKANEGDYSIVQEQGSGDLQMSVPGESSMPVFRVSKNDEETTYTALGEEGAHVIRVRAGRGASYGLQDRETGDWLIGPFPIDPDWDAFGGTSANQGHIPGISEHYEFDFP